MITEEDRQRMRNVLGRAVLTIQDKNRHHNPSEVMPEIISALMTLAAFISDQNLGIGRDNFLTIAKAVADEQWSPRIQAHIKNATRKH